MDHAIPSKLCKYQGFFCISKLTPESLRTSSSPVYILRYNIPFLSQKLSSSQLLGDTRSISKSRCCKDLPSSLDTKSATSFSVLACSSGVCSGFSDCKYRAHDSCNEGTGSRGSVCCRENVPGIMKTRIKKLKKGWKRIKVQKKSALILTCDSRMVDESCVCQTTCLPAAL